MCNKFYSISPLKGQTFGAEIFGINLNNCEFSSELFQQVKKDLQEFRFLLFRNQPLISQKQVDFSNGLGKVESTFYKHPRSPHPDIFRVSNDPTEGCTNVGRTGWHIDGTFQDKPFRYQTMYFPSVAEGGDTWFVPLKELYELQSKDTKDRWDRYWMVTGGRRAPTHPLVYLHPSRGDVTLCFHCGRPFVRKWMMDSDTQPSKERYFESAIESRIVQQEITDAIESSDIMFKMKWQANDFGIVDNLSLAHYACPGTQETHKKAGLRILHRTTITGQDDAVPTKKDGRKTKIYL